MRQEGSCSAKRIKQWKQFHPHKMLCCSTANVLYIRLESGRPVIWLNSTHPLQKDMAGQWTVKPSRGFLYGPHYLCHRKPAVNLSSVAAKVQKAVVQGVLARRHTGSALNCVVAIVINQGRRSWHGQHGHGRAVFPPRNHTPTLKLVLGMPRLISFKHVRLTRCSF